MANAATNLRRFVAIEFGTWRSGQYCPGTHKLLSLVGGVVTGRTDLSAPAFPRASALTSLHTSCVARDFF